MQILELASNITLRLFLRQFEAVLSFKSLFEEVPDHRLSSYFTWQNIFAPRFPWDHFWGCHDILKFWGRLRPSEAEANSHIGLIFYVAEYFCALVFMRPFLRLSQHLASASDGLSLKWPRATSEFQNVATASKMVSWKPGRKNIQPRKIWAQSVFRNPFKQTFKWQKGPGFHEFVFEVKIENKI